MAPEPSNIEIIKQNCLEEGAVLQETKALLGRCATGEERIQLYADRILRATRINAMLDWYNEEVLGIRYEDT